MAKSFRFKNNIYLDSSSVVVNRANAQYTDLVDEKPSLQSLLYRSMIHYNSSVFHTRLSDYIVPRSIWYRSYPSR